MVRALAVFLASMVLALAASPVLARAAPAGSLAIHDKCFAYGPIGTTIEEVAADASRWQCDSARPSITPEMVFFRFNIPAGDKLPHYFLSRRSVFDTLGFMVVDANGATRRSSVPYAAVEPAHLGYMFKVRMPKITADTHTIYAAMALPTQRITLERAMVAPQGPGFNPQSAGPLFLLAAICGMLLMPLVLNLAAYRVLREPFLLWHTAMLVSIIVLILISSGLSTQVAVFTPHAISFTIVTSFSAFVATGTMFAYAYLEPGKLNPSIRRLLPWASLWVMAIGLLHAAFPFVLRPINSDLFYAGFLPVLVLFVIGITDALRRGSRAAKFQLIGWVPLLLLGMIRLITHLLPIFPATDAMTLLYIGCVFDALATTLGVSDRYMAIKRDRDRAEEQARVAEGISERDPLTGLLNRRAIEPRFSLLHREGFETLAVIDLDHFKTVNDQYGHTKGDEVLQAAASALTANDDTMAMRLGGEEFLLLLRGPDAMRRAEQCRQSISTRVAQEVEGLDRVVTASMGVVQVPLAAMPDALFADLYTRADRLLYQAKKAGRNRMMSEKMTVFAPRRQDRRQRARRGKPRAA
jgi:diguanylate cyclase (GGDEF)-like protein